jgi:hypothetical protein
MVGAESPERVTHGFCLSDSRWMHGMLEAREHSKIIENRQCRFSPGWYAVSLSHSASTGVYEEMSFRKRYPDYPGPMAYRTGQVRGLVKVGYSLPQGACKSHRWAAPDYDVANIITEVLPFDPERPGPSVRGNFGTFPLKGAERATRASANFAIGAGHRRKTHAEAALPEQPNVWQTQAVNPSRAAKGAQARQASQKAKALQGGRQPASKDGKQVSTQSSAGASAGAVAKRKMAPVTKRPKVALSPSLRTFVARPTDPAVV